MTLTTKIYCSRQNVFVLLRLYNRKYIVNQSFLSQNVNRYIISVFIMFTVGVEEAIVNASRIADHGSGV
jgi:hypothetical protein